jgi:hypothetical protein
MIPFLKKHHTDDKWSIVESTGCSSSIRCCNCNGTSKNFNDTCRMIESDASVNAVMVSPAMISLDIP